MTLIFKCICKKNPCICGSKDDVVAKRNRDMKKLMEDQELYQEARNLGRLAGLEEAAVECDNIDREVCSEAIDMTAPAYCASRIRYIGRALKDEEPGK